MDISNMFLLDICYSLDNEIHEQLFVEPVKCNKEYTFSLVLISFENTMSEK